MNQVHRILHIICNIHIIRIPCIILLILILFSIRFNTFSQPTNLIRSIGPVTSWKRIPGGIEGATASVFFRIMVVNDNIVRVRISQQREMDDFSYVLVDGLTDPGQGFVVFPSEGTVSDSLLISTGQMTVKLEMNPSFRLVFRTRDGRVIQEDVAGEGFGTTFSGNRPTVYKRLFPGERFVGLGETLGNLDKRGSAHRLNNTDTYKYGDPRMPMYVSIPFYIGIHDSLVYGFFLNNTHESFFNFGISTPGFTSVSALDGDMDYFLISGENIEKVLYHYTSLTGRMALPPRWSLGYHQSRCSYFPEENVKVLARTFRSKRIPADCIVLDADYLQDYEPFRINTNRFPDMKGLTAFLDDLDFEVTASVNPGIKIDSTYSAYHDGLKNDLFLKFSDGSLYTSDIAPSTNHFVDFTKPASRAWWAENMKFLPENGIHGFWNDMNEPAVGGSYLPENLLFDFDGRKANTPAAKNLYGMLMARSSYEAAVKHGGNRRPFVLSRSGFAGIQRYAAVWTGDNTARDEFIHLGAMLNTQLGLSGLPFVGEDIGGYIGPTSRELFIRWIESGVFSPYCRNHKEAFSACNEPWCYGEEAEAIAREYIGFRYRLMPYLYSAFRNAANTGMPVARSLCISDPFDGKVYDPVYQSEFQFGDAILVVPVSPSDRFRKFYLPEGQWYDIFSDSLFTGPAEYTRECPIYEIPLFVRASSLIPVQSQVMSTREKPSDTLFLHVYPGIDTTEFNFYEDDGMTTGYLSGQYYQRKINFDPEQKALVFQPAEGEYPSAFRYVKCIFHNLATDARNLSVNGKPLTSNLQPSTSNPQPSTLLDPLRYLESIYDPLYFKTLRDAAPVPDLVSVVIPWEPGLMRLTWE